MLEVQNIHTYYGNSHVLHGLSLTVPEHSVVALLGRNGMGKTTTLRSIIGFNPPREGTISFKGENTTHLKSYQIAQRGIGLVPQGRRIFPSLTVEENLTIAARSSGKSGDSVWNLDKVYSFFPVLKERSGIKGTSLSGGEQQMLCMCRALMTNPDLLLMDEPSEGLAPIIVKEISRIIGQIKEQGYSILLVEQNLGMALGIADYVYVCSKGQIVYEAKPEELAKNQQIKDMYLGVTK